MRLRRTRALPAVVAFVAAFAAGTVAPASAAGGWTVVPSATPTSSARAALADVACVNDTSCFGVGSYVNAGAVHQLIEHWDGTSWTIVPYASSVGMLTGIACPSSTFCIAVGGQGSGVGAARWNGTSWAPIALAEPVANMFIQSVACSSSTDCFAVGGDLHSAVAPLIEHWNGSAWSAFAAALNPPENSDLVDVACASASFCVAVGASFTPPGQPLIEQWDGTSWSLVTMPQSDDDRMLNGVACTSVTSCVAVGVDSSTGSTLIERFDGSMWTEDASPNSPVASDLNDLFDVACTTSTNCFAVGTAYLNGSAKSGILEQWDGMSWSLVSNPTTSPSITAYAGVACSSAMHCVTLAGRGSAAQVLERWNGSGWAAAGSPVDHSTSNSVLADVACATSTTCFAVGTQTTGQYPATTARTLIEQSGASSWSKVSSPNRSGAQSNVLESVTCPAATVCFAVGAAGSGGGTHTLVERWNGKAWSIVASPNFSKSSKFVTPNVLHGVSCSSATSCFAVGTWYYNGFHTLTVRWDGTTWARVASPNRTSGENTLFDVSCASATSCFAVGRTSPNNSGQLSSYTTLVERWNGTAWSIVASPNAPNGHGELAGVSCASGSACVAVGSSYQSSTRGTLIEAWNGASWKQVASADPSGKTHSALNSVWCKSAASCVAVGSAATSAGGGTLVKTLGGGHWTITPSANPAGTHTSELSGVTCTSTRCFGVGTYEIDGSPRTLVERSS